MESQLIKDLTAMRELLAVPERWTKGVFARGKSGKPVMADGRAAVCWSVGGAFWRVVRKQTKKEVFDALRATLLPDFGTIYDYNDHPDTTHADILAWIDRAIEWARGR